MGISIIAITVIGYLIVAIITAKIAGEKGYNGTGWFFLALLGSIFMLALIIVAPNRNNRCAVENIESALNEMKQKLEVMESKIESLSKMKGDE